MTDLQQSKTIDDELFIPLSEFLKDYSDIQELEKIILRIRPPERLITRKKRLEQFDEYRGYVLDFYVKLRIAKFSKVVGCPLAVREFNDCKYVPKYKLFLVKTDLDYFIFFKKDESGSCFEMVAELDGLYEYHRNSSFIVPVIFEINFGGRGGGLKSKLKMELVQQLYPNSVYFCEVRTSDKNENLGFQIRNRDCYQRRIKIPNSPAFNEIAMKLFQAYLT